MFKVETIEQYKVLQHIKDNFEMKWFELQLVDKFTIRVTDMYNDELLFRYNVKNGVIEETNEESIKF